MRFQPTRVAGGRTQPTLVRSTLVAVLLACLGPVAARAEYRCERVRKHDVDAVRNTDEVVRLCKGLNKPLDLWRWGSAGHDPEHERGAYPATGIRRVLCYPADAERSDRRSYRVVGVRHEDKLALFCLDEELRGSGETVAALNGVLQYTESYETEVGWISTPSSQDFYKSLDVDCACETYEAPGGLRARLMEFTATPSQRPIQKKERHYVAGEQGRRYRVLFDACMTGRTFREIAQAVDASAGFQRAKTVEAWQATVDGEPAGHVLLSKLVALGYVHVNGEDTVANGEWLRENPSECR